MAGSVPVGVKLVVFYTGGKPIYTGDSGRFRVLSFKCGQVGAATTLKGLGLGLGLGCPIPFTPTSVEPTAASESDEDEGNGFMDDSD